MKTICPFSMTGNTSSTSNFRGHESMYLPTTSSDVGQTMKFHLGKIHDLTQHKSMNQIFNLYILQAIPIFYSNQHFTQPNSLHHTHLYGTIRNSAESRVRNEKQNMQENGMSLTNQNYSISENYKPNKSHLDLTTSNHGSLLSLIRI